MLAYLSLLFVYLCLLFKYILLPWLLFYIIFQRLIPYYKEFNFYSKQNIPFMQPLFPGVGNLYALVKRDEKEKTEPAFTLVLEETIAKNRKSGQPHLIGTMFLQNPLLVVTSP